MIKIFFFGIFIKKYTLFFWFSTYSFRETLILYIPLPALPNLKNLDLRFSPIKKIEPGLFKNLPGLESITMSDCEIAELDEHAFEVLKKLQVN